MTRFEQITILAPVDETEASFFSYDQLVSQLSRAAKAPVVVVPDTGKLPEARGPILLNRYGAAVKQRGSANLDDVIAVFADVWPESVRPLLFCLNSVRGDDALTLLDSLGLAGSVEVHDYQVGLDPKLMGKGPYNQSGLYGRREVVTSMGCPLEFEKGRYGKTICAPFPDLPSLLVAYLDEYWRIVQP